MVLFFNVFCIRIFISLELTFVKVDKGFLQYKIIFCSNFANYMFWICKHKNPKRLIFFSICIEFLKKVFPVSRANEPHLLFDNWLLHIASRIRIVLNN